MKIKFSPCKSSMDTVFSVKDENTIEIDGIGYYFNPSYSDYPKIYEDSNENILKAFRENGFLYVTLIRKYKNICPWDDKNYRDII